MAIDQDALQNIDWVQVVLNGGPPCFHLEEDGRFCLRAERWSGHHVHKVHKFVSLAAYAAECVQAERKRCAEIARKADLTQLNECCNPGPFIAAAIEREG